MGSYCPRVAVYVFRRPPPPFPIRDYLGVRTHAAAAAYIAWVSICLASPDLGGGGAYIYWSICRIPPLASRPLGTSDRR